MKAYQGSTVVSVRGLINSFKCTLTSYSQITEVIDYLTEYPANLQKDMEDVDEHFKKFVNQSDFEEAKKKKVRSLCNQLILHPKEPSGSRL